MAKRKCGHCGNVPDGHAKIGDVWLCHPDDETKPDCYQLYQVDGVMRILRDWSENHGAEPVFIYNHAND